jgi:hypothetical protein
MPVTRGPLSGTMGTYYNVLFLVDNDELAELLASAPFRISGGPWIPASEWPEGCVDYLDRHAHFLAAMRQPGLNPLHWSFGLLLRLALSREIYRPIPKENGQIYLELYEPDVGLEIAGAVINARNKLQVNLVSNDGGAVGLRMSYRKKVTYDSEGHAIQHATEEFPNYALYRKLEKRIKERTKPCRFDHAGQVVTTQLRVSDGGREILRNHGWLASKSVRLL